MEKEKATLNVVVDVKAVNYQNGNVMQSTGKLKTVFGGRGQIAMAEESLSFRGTDCTKSQMEVNYNSANIGEGEKNTEVQLEIKGGILTKEKELIDVVSANAGFTKSEILVAGNKTEDWLKVKMENSCDAKCAATESFYTHKTTEITK